MTSLLKSVFRGRAHVVAVVTAVFVITTSASTFAEGVDPYWGDRTLRLLRERAKATPTVPTLVNYAFTPNVISEGATGTIRLSVRMTGPLPTRLQLISEWGVTYDFADTGSNGDLTAGDGIYSTLIPVSQILTRRVADDIFRVFVGYIDVYEGATRTVRVNTFAQVRTGEIPGVSVRPLSATTQLSTNVLNISSASLFRTHDIQGPSNQEIAKIVLSVLPDQYDFLNIVIDRQQIENRYHFGIVNTIAGIGVTPYNNRSEYGNPSKLLGISVFPSAGLFDGAIKTFSHELGHQWLSFLKNPSLAGGVPHWPASTMASGVMGQSIAGSGAGGNFGCELTPEGEGLRTRALSAQRVIRFNPLELYVAGFVGPEEVPDQWVVTDANFSANWLTLCDGRLLTSGFERLTINDVIAANGMRTPTSSATQRTFRVATIVVSDGLLSSDAMSLYDYFAKRMELRETVAIHEGFSKGLSAPFFVATGGRAAVIATVDPNIPLASKVTVVEYFNSQLNYYFLTSRDNEKVLLDTAPGWAKTGASFPMLANPVAEASGNVRFYFDKIAKSGTRGSHFYSINSSDIATLHAANPINANIARLPVDEGIDSFAYRPTGSGTSASCTAGTAPVYRLFRGGTKFPDDPNHRFTTSKAIYDQFIALGWDGEGINFCVPSN